MIFLNSLRIALVLASLALPATRLAAQDFWQVYSRSPFANVYAICPAGSNAMVILTDSGVFRTSDGGSHWVPTPLPHITLNVYTLPNTIVHTPMGTIVAMTDSGLYRSGDVGASWVRVTQTRAGCGVVVGNALYAELVDSLPYHWCIFKSTDDGLNWIVVNSKLAPFVMQNAAPYTVTNDGRIVTDALYAPYLSGYVASSDTGWVLFGRGAFWGAVVRSSSGVLFGSFNASQRSSDNGANWEWIAPDFDPTSMWPSPAGAIFGTSYGPGIDYSTDNGSTWTRENSGLTNTGIYSMGFDDQGYAYAGSFDVIFKSVKNHLSVSPTQPIGTLAAYPNPCSKLITFSLRSTSGRSEISLVDCRGIEWVRASNNAGGAATLDVSRLPAGLYMAQIRYDDGSVNRTLIAHE